MSDEPKPPKPIIKKMRWPFPIIWLVPVAAACLAGYYIHQHHQENGTEINIQFDDGSGIKPNETTLLLHGVTIGHVKSVELTGDHQHAVAHVQLETSAKFLTQADTLFWLVKPEVSGASITGLTTLVSGPYIDCRPGGGAPTTNFIGLGSQPMIIGPGIKIILAADQISQLSVDSPVSYRGIQVGIVKDIRLSSNAESVNVTVFIWDRYKNLVRTHSEFWMLKGADIQGSIFSGLKLKLGSVQNLLVGGVSFATPEKDYGNFVGDGAQFALHDQPKDEWLKWKAEIELPPEEPSNGDQKAAANSEKKELPAINKHE
jgi:paraquat-inducible protein B